MAVSYNDVQDGRDLTQLHSVLHPSLLQEAANIYGALLCSGSRALLVGYILQEPEITTPKLWVTSMQLLHCSWQPTVIRHLIDLIVQDKFGVNEAADALNVDSVQAAKHLHLDLMEQQWKAAELSQTLQDFHTCTAHVSAEMVDVLRSFEGLRNSYPAQ